MSDILCSEASLDAEEPLAGTATESIQQWLLLEINDAWAPKVLQTEAFPEPVRTRLRGWSDTPGNRLQLIRRPGRSSGPGLFMSVSPDGRMSRTELDRIEDLVELDIDALPVEPATPFHLVCVHGRRDRCCARHGSAVYRALQKMGVEVWQTSHLGGHRFAACVLSLPDGLMYGRVRPGDVEALVTARAAGEVGPVSRLRGRCRYDRPTQAAEIFLRRRTDERANDALEWLDSFPDGEGRWTVRFRSASGERVVEVALEETSTARPPSCGAEPETVTRFVER